MKSSTITNCNSDDQLLQLVPIQLLQKAYVVDSQLARLWKGPPSTSPCPAEITFSGWMVFPQRRDLYWASTVSKLLWVYPRRHR